MNARQAYREAAAHRKACRFAEADAALAPWVERVLQHPTEDLRLTFDLLAAQAQTLACLGRDEQAMALSTRGLALAQQHADWVRQDETVAFDTVNQFSQWAHAAMETMQAAPAGVLRVLDAGAEFVRTCGKPTWQAGIFAAKAHALSDIGRAQEAIAAWEQAIALKSVDRSSPGVSWMSMRRSYAYELMEVERREEAVQLLAELLAEGASGLDALACHCYRGHGLLDLGRYPEAAEHADRALELARAMSPEQEISALGLAVEAYLYTGREEDAASAAQRILELARRSGRATSLCSAWQDCADVALWSLDVAAAEAAIAEMSRYAAQVDAYYGRQERGKLVEERQHRLALLRKGEVEAVRRPARGVVK